MNAPRVERRYEPILKIASGGTATVWVGAAAGALGFRQLVAIKRPHAHLADDPSFKEALVDEAKIAARLRHANVVDVRDVEADESGIQLVMDWVEGASLSDLIRAWALETPERPAAVAIRVALDACEGLRALHELTGDDGRPLGAVHRDVSPANILVGLDGVGRITDFGLAKPLAVVERTTSEGALRGKLGYMAPEYIRGKAIDARVDVFAMGIVLWEAVARKRLFRGENDAETLDRVQNASAPPLAEARPELGEVAGPLDTLIARALAKDPEARIATIEELAFQLETIAREHSILATHGEVRDSFGTKLKTALEERRREVQRLLADPNRPEPLSSPPTWRPPAKRDEAPAPDPLPTEVTAAPVSAATPTKPRATRAVWAAIALVPIAIVAAVIVASLSGDSGSLHATSAHSVAADPTPRADEQRARAASAEPTATPPTRPVVHHAAPHASTPKTDEPGKKDPRPNPYGK